MKITRAPVVIIIYLVSILSGRRGIKERYVPALTAVAEFVIEQLDGLNIHQAHFCGHSLGGMVSQQLAWLHPERVHKLVLAETAFGTQNTISERIQTLFAKVFLQVTPQSTLIDLSARQYGSLNSHVANFVREEMNLYDHKTNLRVMSAALGFAGKTKSK